MLKVLTKKINNTDEYSITRYSISGIILKTIIFLILYIICAYLGMYNFREISLSKIIKFIIGSLPFFMFLYLEAISGSSKEVLCIKENNLILKKYISKVGEISFIKIMKKNGKIYEAMRGQLEKEIIEIFTIIKNSYEEWRIKNDESYNKEN